MPSEPEKEWTLEHHLVGSTLPRSVPIRVSGQHYAITEQNTTLQFFQPEDIPARKPALWRSITTGWEEHGVALALDNVASDMQDPVVLDISHNQRVLTDRIQSILLKEVLDEYLPDLIMVAALEEVTAQFLKQRMLEENETAITQSSASSKSNLPMSPPRYYSKPPSSYLTPPVFNDPAGKESSELPVAVQFTPNQLVARIKQGCAMVYALEQANNPPPSSINTSAMSERRSSSRIARKETQKVQDETDRTALWKIVPGGKVATFLHNRLYQKSVPASERTKSEVLDSTTYDERGKEKSSELMKQEPTEESNQAQIKSDDVVKILPKEITKVDEHQNSLNTLQLHAELPLLGAMRVDVDQKNDHAEDEEISEPADETYSPEADAEGDADEEDETGSYTKENLEDLQLENVHNAKDRREVTVDKNGDGEEETDGEGIEVIDAKNPYLQPTNSFVLEWLGRKTGKYLSNEDLQNSFPQLIVTASKKKKMKASQNEMGRMLQTLVTPLDRLVWRYTMASEIGMDNPEARLALETVVEEDPPDVMKWETSYFGRTQFTLRVLHNSVAEEVKVREANGLVEAEAEYKAKKTWDSHRYKGIHGGHTCWPSWTDGVANWYEEQKMHRKDEDKNDAQINKTSIKENTNDILLAQSIADLETEGRGSSRRAKRRGVEGGGVFYGTQSNMTQKQLMDTLLRLVSQNSFQTAASLLSAVPEESSDPMRRIRTALGRVLWKRNQVARISVKTAWTDLSIWKTLQSGPLLSIADSAYSNNANVSTCSLETNLTSSDFELIEYVRRLHQIELGLRSLVIKHLTEIPLAIIATAADERPGTMEAMDDADFEGSGGVQWQSTGHSFLTKRIFRPSETQNTNDLTPCYWFTVHDFAPSIASGPEDEQAPSSERAVIGNAKNCNTVERRMRFRASLESSGPNGDLPAMNLLLTEAQVLAGLKAAEIESNQKGAALLRENPFSNEIGAKITLLSSNNQEEACSFNAAIAGHNSIVGANGQMLHTVLMLPDKGSSRQEAFWATLEASSRGMWSCKITGDPYTYFIQQFDYHSGSAAFEECRAIVNYIRRHPKTAAFQEPVDPVALGVPEYFSVVKKPMDISTLSNNLEEGKYSNIPPATAIGRTPVARMLNGPFRKDVERIFNNAMLFNPPDDWIHQSAATAKKAALKKIEQATKVAEEKAAGTSRQKKSIYIDYDSDVDMYVDESDQDEDFGGLRKSRKRKAVSRPKAKEDASSRAVEAPIRLQKMVSESLGLRGPFANLPISTDPLTFSLPADWTCKSGAVVTVTDAGIVETEERELSEELGELITLHKQTEAAEVLNLRRSTRGHLYEEDEQNGTREMNLTQFEYLTRSSWFNIDDGASLGPLRNRLEVELSCERLHEEYFAREYDKRRKQIVSTAEDGNRFGHYTEGSFPPYLGHLVPMRSPDSDTEMLWEIRPAYIAPALRWVIRGLVNSQHLAALEPLTTDSMNSGVVLANHIYYLDPSTKACEVLNLKEIQRRKRADHGGDQEESEDEIELSEYDKLRAERVARNADRLKALGLA
jgi:hypothetical protein